MHAACTGDRPWKPASSRVATLTSGWNRMEQKAGLTLYSMLQESVRTLSVLLPLSPTIRPPSQCAAGPSLLYSLLPDTALVVAFGDNLRSTVCGARDLNGALLSLSGLSPRPCMMLGDRMLRYSILVINAVRQDPQCSGTPQPFPGPVRFCSCAGRAPERSLHHAIRKRRCCDTGHVICLSFRVSQQLPSRGHTASREGASPTPMVRVYSSLCASIHH